jgi:proteasome accessory factor C
VHYPLSFDRPLRLTAAEALALLAAGQVVLQAPGADPEGPLARALGKVARSLGVDPAAQVEVQLSEASQQTFRQLDRAIQERRQVEIDYYAYNRDERSTRVIDPYRLWSNLGAWYVLGWCHRASGERTFRLDGIVGLRALDTSFEPPTERPTTAIYEPSPDDPRVTIDLEPEASWVVEKYPVEALEQLADGRLRATLAVSAVPWLERLLLRLGPGVGLVGQSGGADLRTVGPTAARRVLARYEHS